MKPTKLFRLTASISRDWQKEEWGMRGRVQEYDVTGKATDTHTLIEVFPESEMYVGRRPAKTRIHASEVMKVEESRYNAGGAIHLSIYYAPEQKDEARAALRNVFEIRSTQMLENARAIRAVWDEFLANDNNPPAIHARTRSRQTA